MRTSDPAEGVVAIRNGLGRSRGIRRRVDLVALDERPGPRDRRGRPVREGVGGLLSAKYVRDGTAPGGVVRILVGRDRIRLLVAHPKEVLTERAIRVLIRVELSDISAAGTVEPRIEDLCDAADTVVRVANGLPLPIRLAVENAVQNAVALGCSVRKCRAAELAVAVIVRVCGGIAICVSDRLQQAVLIAERRHVAGCVDGLELVSDRVIARLRYPTVRVGHIREDETRGGVVVVVAVSRDKVERRGRSRFRKRDGGDAVERVVCGLRYLTVG